MTSHGVPRFASKEEKSAQARQEELVEIKKYQDLIDLVNTKVAKKEYTPELLQKTAELLKINPEYYTIWNHRRRIYAAEFQSLHEDVRGGAITDEGRHSQVLDVVQLDLRFLFPLLVKYPKCYWIWNHRLWLLQQSTIQLPASTARRLWEEELVLVGKMLTRDKRNFHGWGYRRTVIESLESRALGGSSMAQDEFDYTTKMINQDLSNFSAWHNRSKVILKMLDEKQATDEERKEMLDSELEEIHRALFDPYDQSLWFYHQNLMCAFDPKTAEHTMAPNLSKDDKLQYIAGEREYIEDLLEDAKDSKWVYQALIDVVILSANLGGSLPETDKEDVLRWIDELHKLDPLRRGRWNDLRRRIEDPFQTSSQ